jgi:hypothetical protein
MTYDLERMVLGFVVEKIPTTSTQDLFYADVRQRRRDGDHTLEDQQ